MDNTYSLKLLHEGLKGYGKSDNEQHTNGLLRLNRVKSEFICQLVVSLNSNSFFKISHKTEQFFRQRLK